MHNVLTRRHDRGNLTGNVLSVVPIPLDGFELFVSFRVVKLVIQRLGCKYCVTFVRQSQQSVMFDYILCTFVVVVGQLVLSRESNVS